MKECLTNCDQCDEESTLVRVPAITFIKTGTTTLSPTNQKVGELVEQHIHDSREELVQEKADLRGKDYKEKK